MDRHHHRRRQLGALVKLANTLALCFLVANIAFPRYTANEACVFPPPSNPLETDHYIVDTWTAVHHELFGAVEPNHQTALYNTDVVLQGPGVYTGHNNVGQPFTLTVIRHFYFTGTQFTRDLSPELLTAISASGAQWGLIWGTITTGMGSANVIAMSVGADPDPTSSSSTGMTGFVPLIDHDVLMNIGEPPVVTATGGHFTFSMMNENGTGICDPVIEECAGCLPNGPIWCPCDDPAVVVARQNLDNCLETAARNLAIQSAITFAAFSAGMVWCALAGSALPVYLLCVAAAAVACALAVAGFLLLYQSNVKNCWDSYRIAYNAALNAACNPQP